MKFPLTGKNLTVSCNASSAAIPGFVIYAQKQQRNFVGNLSFTRNLLILLQLRDMIKTPKGKQNRRVQEMLSQKQMLRSLHKGKMEE